MLISSSTNAYQQIGLVSTNIFTSILPFLYLVLGIILAFFIVELIIDTIRTSQSDKKVQEKMKYYSEITERIEKLDA